VLGGTLLDQAEAPRPLMKKAPAPVQAPFNMLFTSFFTCALKEAQELLPPNRRKKLDALRARYEDLREFFFFFSRPAI
jgi:hypothetical protein